MPEIMLNPPSTEALATAARRSSNSAWQVLLATWLGGVFDGMDSSIFAIVLYPSLSELLGTGSHVVVGQHGSFIIAMFMVGWALGAMFFGILSDYIGRVRTLMLTILLYALCTGLCATATEWWHLGIFRFLVGAGIGGEMGTGAVMLSECWPRKSRIFAVSAMATSLGFGYLLTASLNLALGQMGWRWLFVAGIVPALLTVYIRSRLKESDHFSQVQEERARILRKAKDERTSEESRLLRLTVLDLFSEHYRVRTLVVILLTSSAIIAWWAVLSWIPAWINQLTGSLAVAERSWAMFSKDFGMILSGCLGGLILKYLGYRKSMGIAFVAALVSTVAMFQTVHSYGWPLLVWILAVGFFAHLPFVFLWIYIPVLYETRVRGSAFGFSYNVGRFLAAAAALGSGELIRMFSGSYATAASCVAAVFLLGAAASFFMPAPLVDEES